MSWTQKQILDMDEATLQEQVLVPVFVRMGYEDVHIHQGSSEAGKDIVMWKLGDFGQRINYAVVAKAKKISGSVSGNSGASTVAAQINQCFGKNYFDHVTTDDERIHQVYVVNSHEIPKEAIEAIKIIINNNIIDRATTFIDGNKLWKYIEKYLPERIVIDQLNQANKIFSELDPHWRVNSTISEEGVILSIAPKTPEAVEEYPQKISGTFVFSDTPEGHTKREEFEQAIKTGSEVTLVEDEIERLDWPEFVAPLLGEPNKEKRQLTIVRISPEREH